MAINTDIIRYRLYSVEKDYQSIPEPISYDKGNRDVIERNKDSKQFEVSKGGAIELYGEAFDYIVALQAIYGIIPDLRLIETQKSDDKLNQRWKVTSNVGLDLGTCDFDYERRTVKVETRIGGLMQIIDARFDDEYDVLSNETIEGTTIGDLETVNVRLDPRKIFRRSRLEVDGVATVTASVSGNDGLNARAIPLQVDYNSDQENIQNVLNVNMDAASGNYATAKSSGVMFYLVADRDRTIRINGTVKTRITKRNSGVFALNLVRYSTDDLLFDEIIQTLDTCNPNTLGDICSYTFNDYEVNLTTGDSLALSTLSDTSDGIEFEVFDTAIIVEEDDIYPQTYTKAVKPSVLIERLIALGTGYEDSFDSELFGAGGKYENTLLVHGSWLRNMPRIINEGEDDERVVQASTSLSDVYEALSIREPLMYGTKNIGNKEYFYTETEKHGQRNFTAIKLGETKDKFSLIPIDSEVRKVLPDNFYSSINIGSESTGSEYGEVNNLYSICGNATWNTINNTNKSEYKVLTSFRTGSVDVELTRQKQYDANPDTDSDYDNDWFMLDCKYNGVEYELKKWADFYTTQPTNVYSADTEYNWMFTPLELLKGHGWKINAGLVHYPTKFIRFASSNCTSNLITDGFQHDQPIKHTTLDKPTFNNMTVNFKLYVNQEISEMLRGTTNGIDNKFGLVQFQSDGIEQYGRLIKVDENNEGTFELIEAYL